MIRRALIILAVLVYALVLACTLQSRGGEHSLLAAAQPPTPGPATAPSPLAGLPYRSIGMEIQRVDWIDKYQTCIDKIAAVGADAVLLTVDGRQEDSASSHIYLDMRCTPTIPQLAQLIDHAKSLGLRVILMPIVLLDNPVGRDWRGTIHPDSWDKWFDSYRAMMTHFAIVAQLHHVDLLVVGSELVSSEPKVEQWTKTIALVRAIYGGHLTYSSNWDRYTSVPFWDQLDLIGMNSYWKLGKNKSATVEEIKSNWQDIQKDLLPFLAKQRKPLIFLEAGWCSIANAASAPWDYTQEEEPLDMNLQRRLYEGFFESWYGRPQLGGFSIWEWTADGGGPTNRGYTPENKPAEKVLREWFAKPRWKVQ